MSNVNLVVVFTKVIHKLFVLHYDFWFCLFVQSSICTVCLVWIAFKLAEIKSDTQGLFNIPAAPIAGAKDGCQGSTLSSAHEASGYLKTDTEINREYIFENGCKPRQKPQGDVCGCRTCQGVDY